MIFTTEVIINKPTSIKAGAVADAGTIKKIGARKSARANIIAVERAVSPVLPPTATPDALSTYEVTVLVPITAPTVVPNASAKRAFFNCGKFPSLSVIPILDATPNRVPIVSKRFTNKKVNTTISISKVKMLVHSNCKNIGDTSGGNETKLP